METKTNPSAALQSTAATCVTSLHSNKTKFALKQKLLMLMLFALWGYAGFGQLTVSINNYINAYCGSSVLPAAVCSGGHLQLEATVAGVGSGSYSFIWSTPGTTYTSIIPFGSPSFVSIIDVNPYSLSSGTFPVTVTAIDNGNTANTATFTYFVHVIPNSPLPLAVSAGNVCPFNGVTLNAANPNTQFINTYLGTTPFAPCPIPLSTPPITTTETGPVPTGVSPVTVLVALANIAGTCQNIQQLSVNVETYTSCRYPFLPHVAAGTFLTNAMVPSGPHFIIEGDITISGTVSFTGKTIEMAPGATINVPAGASLNINGSWLRVCPASSCMWNGIVVTGNGQVTSFNSSIIEDAVAAINISTYLATPLLHVTQTLFNKNTTAIEVSGAGAFIDLSSQITIDNNIFTCRAFSTGALGTLRSNVSNFNSLFNNLQSYWDTYTPAATTTNYGQISKIGVGIHQYINTNLITIGSTTPVSTSGFSNIFDNLQYGVQALDGNINVAANQFQNLGGQSIATPISGFTTISTAYASGVGVYAAMDSKTNGIITIGGTGSAPNTFNNTLRGIDIYGYNTITVTGNTLYNNVTNNVSSFTTAGNWIGQYGIQVSWTNTKTIAPNWLINTNSIQNSATGIHVMRFAYNVASVVISCNDMQATPLTAYNPTLYMNQGIVFEDATGSSTVTGPVQISYNNVHRAALNAIICTNVKYGLDITGNGAVGFTPYGNELSVWPGGSSIKTLHTVIQLNYCDNAGVGKNARTFCAEAGLPAFNTNLICLEINQSLNTTVYCNEFGDVSSTVPPNQWRWGIVYNGPCFSPNSINYNWFNGGHSALNLAASAAIGPQGSLASPAINRWSSIPLYTNTFSCAIPLNTTSPLTLYTNYIGGASKHGGTTPSPYSPPPTYLPPATNCGISTISYDVHHCGSIIDRGINCTGTCSLFTCFIGIPSSCNGGGSHRVDSLTVAKLQPVYNDTNATGLLAAERVWQNRRYLWQRILNDTLYSHLTDTAVQHFYTANTSTGFGMLAQADLALSQKNVSAAASYNSFAPANTMETKQQQVNAIKIKLMDTTGTLPVTAADKATLQSIANGCPDMDGKALYEARTLLNLFSGMQLQYTDTCPAGVSSLRLASTTGVEPIVGNGEKAAISLFPNPNTGSFTLSYSIDQDAVLYIYDVQGKQVFSLPLTAEQKSAEINNLNLENGVYMYKVVGNDILLNNGKLIILK